MSRPPENCESVMCFSSRPRNAINGTKEQKMGLRVHLFWYIVLVNFFYARQKLICTDECMIGTKRPAEICYTANTQPMTSHAHEPKQRSRSRHPTSDSGFAHYQKHKADLRWLPEHPPSSGSLLSSVRIYFVATFFFFPEPRGRWS